MGGPPYNLFHHRPHWHKKNRDGGDVEEQEGLTSVTNSRIFNNK